jgi:hypothetical protein
VSHVHIKFSSEQDELKGFYTLATQVGVESILGEIFRVPKAGLHLLDKETVKYTIVPEDEARRVYQRLRAFQEEKAREGIVPKVKKLAQKAFFSLESVAILIPS